MEERLLNSQHPEGLTDTQERLAMKLFEIEAIKLGLFRLKLHDTFPEAPLSTVYLDLRVIQRNPFAKRLTAVVYEQELRRRGLAFDILAPVPTAAVPIASSLADRLSIGMVTPRLDSKTHGMGASVDGKVPGDEGKTALLIDDVITIGGSKLKAVGILRNAGIKVRDALVLVDREQGGREELAKEGVTLHAAFTLKQMLDFYLRNGQIEKTAYEKVFSGQEQLNRFLQSH